MGPIKERVRFQRSSTRVKLSNSIPAVNPKASQKALLRDRAQRKTPFTMAGTPARAEEGLDDFTQDGTVDLRGNPVRRSKRGGWTACSFVVGNP